ncbi:hypothetical protein, partial [Aquimarina algiphila]|uniref:hypothetical protein n=1 Tax=Aquimarina algiphila TaxID=2047982 RepID=UPI00232CEF81
FEIPIVGFIKAITLIIRAEIQMRRGYPAVGVALQVPTDHIYTLIKNLLVVFPIFFIAFDPEFSIYRYPDMV